MTLHSQSPKLYRPRGGKDGGNGPGDGVEARDAIGNMAESLRAASETQAANHGLEVPHASVAAFRRESPHLRTVRYRSVVGTDMPVELVRIAANTGRTAVPKSDERDSCGRFVGARACTNTKSPDQQGFSWRYRWDLNPKRYPLIPALWPTFPCQ